MTDTQETRPTSAVLEQLVCTQEGQETATVGEIAHSLKELGFGVLLALAALPLCIPVPKPPGYGTLFAIPLFLLSIQMILGRESPWLPLWLTRRKVKCSTLSLLVRKALPVLRRIEHYLKPRLTALVGAHGEKIIGIAILLLSFSIALPIPFAHTIPGFAILLLALGLLARDGAVVAAGMAVGAVGLALSCTVLYLILVYGTEAALRMIAHFTGSGA